MLFKHIEAPIGWFFSDKFNYWQKTNGRVVVYVSELIFGYQVQLYIRGQIGVCDLEARTSDQSKEGYKKMFKLGEQWLSQYSQGDLRMIQQDRFSISNPNGVWIKDYDEKNMWI